MPVAKAAFSRAVRSTALVSCPARPTCRASLMRASVSVPVLSLHSTSIAPRSWIADRRFTITDLRDRRIAPCASVTDTTIGSSSGVSPTASAKANRKDCSKGRCISRLASSTNSTSSTVSRTIMRPKPRMPTANAVGGGGCCNAWAMEPSCARRPVARTSAVAVPLTTEVPMNTRLAGNIAPAGTPEGGTTSLAAG